VRVPISAVMFHVIFNSVDLALSKESEEVGRGWGVDRAKETGLYDRWRRRRRWGRRGRGMPSQATKSDKEVELVTGIDNNRRRRRVRQRRKGIGRRWKSADDTVLHCTNREMDVGMQIWT